VKANYVSYIAFQDQNIIFPTKKQPSKVLSEETAKDMRSMLESVVIRGTGTRAQTGYATRGKTGTTDQSKDVWFVGNTGNVVGAVWCGNMDMKVVPGLTTDWSMEIYAATIKEAIKNKTIKADSLETERTETLMNIYVPKEPLEDPTLSVPWENVASIEIPGYERPSFEGKELTLSVVCSSSGLLFNPSNCPAYARKQEYFVRGQEPASFCHLIRH